MPNNDCDTEKFLAELSKRYKRKIGSTERVAHHGNCHVSLLDVCTCGLLDFILPNVAFAMDEIEWVYPTYFSERANHDNALSRLDVVFPDVVCSRCGAEYKRDHYRQGCPACHCIVYKGGLSCN